MMNYGWGWGWMVIGGLLMIVFWVAVIAVIVWGVTRIMRGREGDGGESGLSALEIAKRRYARGEITKEQYEQLKKDLG